MILLSCKAVIRARTEQELSFKNLIAACSLGFVMFCWENSHKRAVILYLLYLIFLIFTEIMQTFVSYTNIFLAAKILKNELLHNVEEHVKLSLSQRAQYRILQKDPQLSS